MDKWLGQPSETIGLVIAPWQSVQAMLTEVMSELALRGPLFVLDGGNRFDVYPLARALRRRTSRLTRALQNIHLARAFTCYQMLALLAQTPDGGCPKIVLDLLATFYDENVSLAESMRLLEESRNHLRRLSHTAPILVTAQPPPSQQSERLCLLQALQGVTEKVLVLGGEINQQSHQVFQGGLWDAH